MQRRDREGAEAAAIADVVELGRVRVIEVGSGTFGRVLCVAGRRGAGGADGGAYRGPGSPAATVTLTARVWWARETAR
jgi:hypothetical protein